MPHAQIRPFRAAPPPAAAPPAGDAGWGETERLILAAIRRCALGAPCAAKAADVLGADLGRARGLAAALALQEGLAAWAQAFGPFRAGWISAPAPTDDERAFLARLAGAAPGGADATPTLTGWLLALREALADAGRMPATAR